MLFYFSLANTVTVILTLEVEILIGREYLRNKLINKV
jgi:hypothetical protein